MRTTWGVSENLLKHILLLFGLCHLIGHFPPFTSIIFSNFSCFNLGEPSITLFSHVVLGLDILLINNFLTRWDSAWRPSLRVLGVPNNCTNSLAFLPSWLPIVLQLCASIQFCPTVERLQSKLSYIEKEWPLCDKSNSYFSILYIITINRLTNKLSL